MSNDSWWELVIVVCLALMIFMFGVFLGGISNPYNALSNTSGVPIDNVQMSEDGTTITFNISNTQFSVLLKEAESRPPNLITSARVIITDEQILFLNDEGKNVSEPMDYQSISLLEG